MRVGDGSQAGGSARGPETTSSVEGPQAATRGVGGGLRVGDTAVAGPPVPEPMSSLYCGADPCLDL